MRRALGVLLFMLSLAAPLSSRAAVYALVLQDETPLRPTPGASAKPSTVLWQGEMVEVRAERLDYLQVWDYSRERGGYVRASQVRVLALSEAEAPELLAVLRFLRNVPGSEALGIGIAAAYIEAASAEALNGADGIEALEAMGTLADRLARSASGVTQLKAVAVSAHLEVAERYGVRFVSVERASRVRVCYDGAAWRKLLAMAASEEQRARAALALSEPACARPEVTLAELLDRVNGAKLPGYLRNRVLMRRAVLWASTAYQQGRAGKDPQPAATRAIESLARVEAGELAEADRAAYAEAELRVGAARVALAGTSPSNNLYIATAAGQEGRHRIDFPLGRERVQGGLRDGGHGKPARHVHRGPQRRPRRIEGAHGRLVGEVDPLDRDDEVTSGRRLVPARRQVQGGAGREQRLDDRRPQPAARAGHHHLFPLEVVGRLVHGRQG